ncbi:MAG: o-succinylbenzoate synthase [Muribaculaceae bacterium]|nr:o-succinylbenzoate synthase [Muribaculaceae bacterium]
MRARWYRHRLQFKETAITSRERLDYKTTYILELWDEDNPEVKGVGEVALFESLSKEAGPGFESRLDEVVRGINSDGGELGVLRELGDIGGLGGGVRESSILFGMETAVASLRAGGGHELWPSAFTRGEVAIPINGLVWMGDFRKMSERIRGKLDEGFGCVKLKIGGIDFEDEVALLRMIRREYGRKDLELRLDANGSFTPENAMERLGRLSEYDIHSIEQPIKAGQWEAMSEIAEKSPIAIALDEELIGTRSREEKVELLDAIRPAYVVLKPSLAGGFAHSQEWIELAKERGCGWWITSALESNIGLNALAQFVALQNPTMPQGLGTGELYVENFPSPLVRKGENLWYDVQG